MLNAEQWADPLWRLSNLYTIVTDEGKLVRFTPNDEQVQLYKDLHNRNLVLKARQLGFCVAPETRVLTADLRWVPIIDIKPGMEVVACDEHPPGGRGSARKMRTATVQGVKVMRAQRFRITFDDGREVVCTDRHPWLSRNSQTDAKWRSISGQGNEVCGRLKPGVQVRWIAKPWGESSVEDGWFGGMLDGEGSIAKRNTSAGVNVSQRSGPVWDRLVQYAHERGYNARIENDAAERPSKHGRVPVPKLAFGRMDEMLRLIGQTRPTRFVGNRFWEGRELPGKRNGDVGWATIVSIEDIGEGDVVDMQTSTKTYIAEGFVSHNTTFLAIVALDQCMFVANHTAVLIAHTLPDAKKIFRNKIKRVYDELPLAIRQACPLEREAAEELVFKNGSSINVSTSARGGTTNFLHVSEMGKIARIAPEKAKEIVTGAFESVPADGIIVVESTAEGQDGWFYDACMAGLKRSQEGAQLTRMDFKLHFFPWFNKAAYALDERETELVKLTEKDREHFLKVEAKIGRRLTDGQKAWWIKKKAVLLESMGREYPSTPEEAFEVALEGTIYATQMAVVRRMGRIGVVPVRDGVSVNTYWDFGVDDSTTIWLQQRVGALNRFVKYFEDSGEGLAYYWKKLIEWQAQHDIQWGKHYIPHDGDTRIQGYEVTTRKQMMFDLGMRNLITVPRVNRIDTGIEAVRAILPECEFDAVECAQGIKCLDFYSRTWDDNKGTWSSQPRHDKWSHGADGFRQFAQALKLQFEGAQSESMGAMPGYSGGY